MRDVRAVGSKFYHVLVPRDGSLLLNDWDLWGPLILCTVLAIILQAHNGGREVTKCINCYAINVNIMMHFVTRITRFVCLICLSTIFQFQFAI